MKNIEITSENLIQSNHPSLSLKANDFSKYNFWYYTRLCVADSILNTKSIHISNLDKMNDVNEAELHESNKAFVHCFCLCNSNTEKIPMWYLYSGISGQGVSLGFTPAVMIELIKTIKTITTPNQEVTLHIKKDFDLDYGWVFYRKNDSMSQVMYKRKWYSLKDPEEFEKNNFFIKSYPWEYEKEFRIVIYNKTKIPYDKLVINIAPIYDRIKLKLAPELSNESFNKMLPALPGFSAFLSKVPERSKLSINMNLCERNFESFIDYIRINSSDTANSNRLDYDKICEAISNNCKKKSADTNDV